MISTIDARPTGNGTRFPPKKRPNNVEVPVLTDDDDLTLHGRPRCHGVRNAGGRCQGFAGESGYCFFHDPDVTTETKVEVRTQARGMRGPGNRLVKLMPPRLRPVFEDLVGAMRDLRDGTITPSQATAMAALATASVRVLMSGELEERLRALDAATAGDGDPRGAVYDD